MCVTVQATVDAALAAALAEVIAPPIVRCVCAGMWTPLPRLCGFLRLAFVCVCPIGGGPAEGSGSHRKGPRPFITAGSARIACVWHWGRLRVSAHTVSCVVVRVCAALPRPRPHACDGMAVWAACGFGPRCPVLCVCPRAVFGGPCGLVACAHACLVVCKGVPYGCRVLRCGCRVVCLLF